MNNPVDHQRMLDTATAFFLAAERCVPEFKFGKYGSHSVSAPTLCNYALSVEIALKLILEIHGISAKGHNILLLCRKIPFNERSFLGDYLRPSPVDQKSTIREVSRYFIDWRYSYEHCELYGSYDEIRRIFISCYQEVRRLKPDLKSYCERDWGSFEPDWLMAWEFS